MDDRIPEVIPWWLVGSVAWATLAYLFRSVWEGWFLTGIAVLTLGSIWYVIRPTLWQLRHPRKAWWMHKVGQGLAKEYEYQVERAENESRTRKEFCERYERQRASIVHALSNISGCVSTNPSRPYYYGMTAGIFAVFTNHSVPNKVLIWLEGYENDTSSPDIITFPVPFGHTPIITVNSAEMPGVSVSTTTLSMAPNSMTPYTGWLVVRKDHVQ